MCERPLDLAFLLDSSSDVGPEVFEQIVRLTFAQLLAFRFADDVVRFAVVIYGDHPEVILRLNDYRVPVEFHRDLGGVRYIGGHANLSAAVKELDEGVFSPSYGDRPTVADVVVHVTTIAGKDGEQSRRHRRIFEVFGTMTDRRDVKALVVDVSGTAQSVDTPYADPYDVKSYPLLDSSNLRWFSAADVDVETGVLTALVDNVCFLGG